MCQRYSRRILNSVVLALVLMLPSISNSQTVQTGDFTAQPVPRWLAWRVFHDSLVFYGKRSPAQLRQVLSRQIGLTDLETAKLLGASQTFLANLDSVDQYRKEEAARRYKYVPVQSGPPPDGVTRRPAPPQKSFLERAMEDGFYAQIEAQKQTILNNHIKSLAFDATTLQRIEAYVQSSITPHIKIVNASTSPNPASRPTLQPDAPTTKPR